MPHSLQSDPRRKVFVVHGRNLAARDGVFDFLRALGLEPLEWDEAIKLTGSGSPFVMDVVKAGFVACRAALVLLTGDDEAQLRPALRSPGDPDYEGRLTPQARPNVLFEAGLALGLQPERTIFLRLGDVRPWSDTHGMHFVQLNEATPAWRQSVKERLKGAGCRLNDAGSDWLHAGSKAFGNAATLVAAAPSLGSGRDSHVMLEQVARVYDALKVSQVPFAVSEAEWKTVVREDFSFEVVRRETWHALDKPLVFRTFEIGSDDAPVDDLQRVAFETKALDGDGRLLALPAEDGAHFKRFVGVLLPPVGPHAARRVEWRWRWPGGARRLERPGQWDKHGCILSKRTVTPLDVLKVRMEFPRAKDGAWDYEIEERTLTPLAREIDGSRSPDAPEATPARFVVRESYAAEFRQVTPGAEILLGVRRRDLGSK